MAKRPRSLREKPRFFLTELGTSWLRAEAIKEVRESVASGDRSSTIVRSVTETPATNGERAEGVEFGGELAPGEPAWEAGEVPSSVASRLLGEGDSRPCVEGVALDVHPSDRLDEVVAAQAFLVVKSY